MEEGTVGFIKIDHEELAISGYAGIWANERTARARSSVALSGLVCRVIS